MILVLLTGGVNREKIRKRICTELEGEHFLVEGKGDFNLKPMEDIKNFQDLSLEHELTFWSSFHMEGFLPTPRYIGPASM